MTLPLVILAIFSIFFGYLTKDMFIGLGSGFFVDNSIFIHPNHEILIDTEFAVPILFKLLPFFFTISFSAVAIVSFEFFPELITKFNLSKLGYYIFGFFNQRFLIEMFYNKFITGFVLTLGGHTTKILDKGAIESIGPVGLAKVLEKCSKTIHYLNRGVVTSYALYILLGFIYMLLFVPLVEFVNVILYVTIFIFFIFVIVSTFSSYIAASQYYVKKN